MLSPFIKPSDKFDASLQARKKLIGDFSSELTKNQLPKITIAVILVVLLDSISSASAFPLTFPSKSASQNFEMSPDGSYYFSYDTGPGVHQSFREETRTSGGTVAGSYGYVDPKGVLRITEYVADSKGYRASLEIYEPVHQFLDAPPLIVGPLPLSLESASQRIREEEVNKEQSIFDKYEFPFEPFESLKIKDDSQDEGNFISNTEEFPEFDNQIIESSSLPPPLESVEMFPSNTVQSLDNSIATITSSRLSSTSSVPSSFSSAEKTLPSVDVSKLENELKTLALDQNHDPLLIIGPIPEDLREVSNKPSASKDLGKDQLSDGTRTLRSPVSNNLSDKKALDTTSKSSLFFTTKLLDSNSLNYRRPVTGLNFQKSFPLKKTIKKAEVSKGNRFQQVSLQSPLPSSPLLQGKFIKLNETINIKPVRRKRIRVKKRKLSDSSALFRNLLTADTNLFLPGSRVNTGAKTITNDQYMKLISFEAQNIFRELLKLESMANGHLVRSRHISTPKTKSSISVQSNN